MNQTVVEKILLISKNLKVLFVEDNKDIRESTLLILENFFDNITVGVDGVHGFELYKNHFYDTNSYFDVVISDIEMPRLNGIDMVREIYKINKKQRVIVVSAYSDKEYLIPLLNMGIFGFLKKPCSFAETISIIKKISQSFVLTNNEFEVNCLDEKN